MDVLRVILVAQSECVACSSVLPAVFVGCVYQHVGKLLTLMHLC